MTRIGALLFRDIPPEDLASTARSMAPLVDELWIVEDLNWPGGVSQLAIALEATDDDGSGRPVIGHGIAPAPFRNPAALAMEWATLDRRFPNRIIGGIGHGVPEWMGWIGERVDSPLTLLRETIESTRATLAGPTSYAGRYVTIDNVELKFPPLGRIPVVAGVTGPNSLELSGEVADGTVVAEGHGPDQIRAARERIDTGRRRAGRTNQHDLTVFVGFYCGDVTLLPPPPDDVPTDGYAIVGDTPDDVIADFQALLDASVDSMVLIPFADTVGQLELFRTEIEPRLSPAAAD